MFYQTFKPFQNLERSELPTAGKNIFMILHNKNNSYPKRVHKCFIKKGQHSQPAHAAFSTCANCASHPHEFSSIHLHVPKQELGDSARHPRLNQVLMINYRTTISEAPEFFLSKRELSGIHEGSKQTIVETKDNENNEAIIFTNHRP